MDNQSCSVSSSTITNTTMACCGNRLPCGVCRLLMCMCPNPLGAVSPTPTWTVTTATNTGNVPEAYYGVNNMSEVKP